MESWAARSDRGARFFWRTESPAARMLVHESDLNQETPMTASPKSEVTVHDKLYVNGEWVEPAGKEMLDVINSTTEEVMGRVPEGTAEDINRAVAAARAAFNPWSATSPGERAGLLQKIS